MAGSPDNETHLDAMFILEMFSEVEMGYSSFPNLKSIGQVNLGNDLHSSIRARTDHRIPETTQQLCCVTVSVQKLTKVSSQTLKLKSSFGVQYNLKLPFY